MNCAHKICNATIHDSLKQSSYLTMDSQGRT